MSFDQNSSGIEITAPKQLNEKDGLIIQGTFRIKYPDIGIPESATLIPKQIVLVAVNYGSYSSCKPFYDIVVFNDDIQDDGEFCNGKFNLNVFDHVPLQHVGKYSLLMSLGIHLSNILEVNVI